MKTSTTPSKSSQDLRKVRDRVRRRSDILEAMDRLCNTDNFASYEKLNLDIIAKEAGLSKPTLYRYFQSKEDLLLAYAGQIYKKLSDRIIEEINKTHSFSAKTTAVAMVFFQFAKEFPNYISTLDLMGERGEYIRILKKAHSEEITESENEYKLEWERNRKIVQELVQEKIPQLGSIHDSKFTAEYLAEIFNIVITGSFYQFKHRNAVLKAKGIKDEEAIENIIELLTQGLLSKFNLVK